MQAHLAQWADEALDGDAPVVLLRLAQRRPHVLASLGHQAVQRGEEGLAVGDVEDHGDVGAHAQVGVAAGDGDAAQQQRVEHLDERLAVEAQLPLVALAQAVVAAADLEGVQDEAAPLVELVREGEQRVGAAEGDVVLVVRHQAGERLRLRPLAGLHPLPGVLGDGHVGQRGHVDQSAAGVRHGGGGEAAQGE